MAPLSLLLRLPFFLSLWRPSLSVLPFLCLLRLPFKTQLWLLLRPLFSHWLPVPTRLLKIPYRSHLLLLHPLLCPLFPRSVHPAVARPLQAPPPLPRIPVALQAALQVPPPMAHVATLLSPRSKPAICSPSCMLPAAILRFLKLSPVCLAVSRTCPSQVALFHPQLVLLPSRTLSLATLVALWIFMSALHLFLCLLPFPLPSSSISPFFFWWLCMLWLCTPFEPFSPFHGSEHYGVLHAACFAGVYRQHSSGVLCPATPLVEASTDGPLFSDFCAHHCRHPGQHIF